MGGRRVSTPGVLLAALVGVAATLATFHVQYVGPVVRVSNECEPRDHPDCLGPVLAAGLPLWCVSDSPWVSAGNSLTPWFEDPIRWWAFGADVTLWGAAFAAGARALGSRTGRSA